MYHRASSSHLLVNQVAAAQTGAKTGISGWQRVDGAVDVVLGRIVPGAELNITPVHAPPEGAVCVRVAVVGTNVSTGRRETNGELIVDKRTPARVATRPALDGTDRVGVPLVRGELLEQEVPSLAEERTIGVILRATGACELTLDLNAHEPGATTPPLSARAPIGAHGALAKTVFVAAQCPIALVAAQAVTPIRSDGALAGAVVTLRS